MERKYEYTVTACYVGYMVQAIVNNFAPLLFLTFHNTYNIPMTQITLLITFNFLLQLCVDFLAAGVVDKIGYRPCLIFAHLFSAMGLIGLAILPGLMPSAFLGLLLSVLIYALGGGLLEVLVSPVMEALPTKNKEKMMSLLHSFYCWGHVGVVLLSTLFFTLAGIENWRYLSILWALVPLCNMVAFMKVPIVPLVEEGEMGYGILELLRIPLFWILVLLMICSGASEQAVSQWASTFAEEALQVSKTFGDLAGPMFFAILMGTSRALYGKFGEKFDLKKTMAASAFLCVFAYLLIVFSPLPLLSLLGCGICGFSVGIFWPGTFSIASASMKRSGTALFALLALAGDVGCAGGPTFAGFISGAFGDNLKAGILAAILFPMGMLLGLFLAKKKN